MKTTIELNLDDVLSYDGETVGELLNREVEHQLTAYIRKVVKDTIKQEGDRLRRIAVEKTIAAMRDEERRLNR